VVGKKILLIKDVSHENVFLINYKMYRRIQFVTVQLLTTDRNVEQLNLAPENYKLVLLVSLGRVRFDWLEL